MDSGLKLNFDPLWVFGRRAEMNRLSGMSADSIRLKVETLETLEAAQALKELASALGPNGVMSQIEHAEFG